MQKTISVCIVVKDGKNKIIDCLSSITHFADEIVIIDTGSIDGTPELINSWNNKKQYSNDVILECVGNKFHDSEGNFDFGSAKNYSISKATKDFVMWMDVNDILQNQIEVKKAFIKMSSKYEHVGIILRTKTSDVNTFPRLRIGPRKYVNFIGNIHEYMVNTASDSVIISTKFEFKNYKKGRDVNRNIKSLLKTWNETHTSRVAFYLGNSYRDLHDYENAEDWYNILLYEFSNEKSEELYKARECLCEIYLTNKDYNKLGNISLDMISICPNRPEGYFYRYKSNFELKNYSLALKCLQKMSSLQKPIRTRLWINNKIFNRKYINKLLIEVENYSKYSNMEPLKPEYINNYNNLV